MDLIISKYKNKMKQTPIAHASWNKTATAQWNIPMKKKEVSEKPNSMDKINHFANNSFFMKISVATMNGTMDSK